MIDFKGSQFEREIILWGVRWYVAYSISYRQLEEMMGERGVDVDHSSLNRWVIKYTPLLEMAFRQRKRPVGTSWRMDETYISVKGQWKYLYRAVDKAGHTVDFLLTAKRDRKARPQSRLALLAQVHRPVWNAAEDHHRQKQSQRRGDRRLQQRDEYQHRTATGQVSEQHCRAGPSGDQTNDAPNAGFQIVLVRRYYAGGH